MKNPSFSSKKAYQVPRKVDRNRLIQRIPFLNSRLIGSKRKTLQSSRREKIVTWEELGIRMALDFSESTLESIRQLSNIFLQNSK